MPSDERHFQESNSYVGEIFQETAPQGETTVECPVATACIDCEHYKKDCKAWK
ncbi:MAG: hypothetical protein PHT16_01780 [Candidatus Pacebacteria bacterium]|nr:hypothetical protein [Candidatus Paceibacterota bacterium]